ncbi:hypothetical protein BDV98DRAFT_587605 [Pterulicium gracile]|uniref:Uncharacterized protein n=1 Tax=Pterulicium gracile TaxID=1884261 RepID=A0A5C3R718_9AGAR|nr:hypothetical protein BDV98DRAFT_587605 [Pterula gracilis]
MPSSLKPEMQTHPPSPLPKYAIYGDHVEYEQSLLSPFSLSDSDATMPCKSYLFDFAPPSIESFTTVRRSHQTRPNPPAHAFDALPWISAMDCYPEPTDSWDIADLSQLPPPSKLPAQPRNNQAKPGPIRTARSALRLRPAKLEKPDAENIVAHKAARRVNSTFSLRDASSRASRPPRNVAHSIRPRSLMPEFSFAASICDSCPSEPRPPRPSVQTPPPPPQMTAPPGLSPRPKAVSRLPPSSRPRTCHDSHRL